MAWLGLTSELQINVSPQDYINQMDASSSVKRQAKYALRALFSKIGKIHLLPTAMLQKHKRILMPPRGLRRNVSRKERLARRHRIKLIPHYKSVAGIPTPI